MLTLATDLHDNGHIPRRAHDLTCLSTRDDIRDMAHDVHDAVR